MTMKNLHKSTCIVVKRLASGPAFAPREDNGEAVFIGSKAATRFDLQEMDTFHGILAKNKPRPEKTPCFSVFIESAGCTNCYAMGLAATRLRNYPSRAGLTRVTGGRLLDGRTCDEFPT